MKTSTEDQIKGNVHSVKGSVKEAVGHAVGNPNLEAEGTVEKLAGKLQNKVGQIEKAVEKENDKCS